MEIPKTTFQAKRIVKCGKFPRLIAKPEAKAAKEHIAAHLYNNKPRNVLEPPYRVDIRFHFKAPQSRIKKVKKKTPMSVKPDVDNLAKGFLDCMVEAHWIKADQQVYELNISKYEIPTNDYVSVTIY